jgi:hypothetical protein
LLSKYAGKMLLFLSEGSPSSAKGLTDFEEKSGSDLLEQCGIYSVEYVNPIEIDAGYCWDIPDINAELQEKQSGDWNRNRIVYGLEKTEDCSDTKYPWGIPDFKVTRGLTSITNDSAWDREYRVVWTKSDGTSFADETYTFYTCAKATRDDEFVDAEPECD